MPVGIYQRETIKILIVGGGYGALRYVESLIWDTSIELVMCGMEVLGKTKDMAKKFGLPYISFDNLTPQNVAVFSCVIVTLPARVKKNCVNHLIKALSYRNALILEKPLALDFEALHYYEYELKHFEKACVVCQRDFDIKHYTIGFAERYNIVFPSYVTNDAFIVEHMLPHVLSWLITQENSLDSLKRVSSNAFSCVWRGALCDITFIHRTENTLLSVNGQVYPNVQYRRVNSEIVKKVMRFSVHDTEHNINRAIIVSRLLSQNI